VTLAVVVSTLTAASRSVTAFERLRAATNASDIEVFFEGDAEGLPDAQAAFESTDSVLQSSVQAELFVRPKGSPYFPGFQSMAHAPPENEANRLDVPVIVEGRAASPAATDEVVLAESLADELGLVPGDRVTLESMTTEWVDAFLSGTDAGAPDGPTVEAEVVGLGKSPVDFSRLNAVLYLTPAFAERYRDQVETYTYLRARLSDAGMRAGRAGELFPDGFGGQLDISPFGDDESTEDGLGAIAVALRLVAVAAALAGGVAVALAALRLSRVALADGPTLRALGWTRPGQVRAAMTILAPWLIGGVVVGAALGLPGSLLALRGLARAVDPTPDAIRIDGSVVVIAVAVAIALGAVLVAVSARIATVTQPRSASRITQLWPLRRPLPVVIGARDALVGRVDRGGRASRAAIAIGGAGVAIAVGALVVSASIGRLQTDPRLTGQGGGSSIEATEGIEEYDSAMAQLSDDARVVDLLGVHVVFDVSIDGEHAPSVLAFDLQRGGGGRSLVDGRLPRTDDEVALGPATLESLGKHVGDRITLQAGGEGEGAVSQPRPEEFEVVGTLLFPEGDFAHDEGIATTVEGGNRVVGDVRQAEVHQLYYVWGDEVDVATADRELSAAGFLVAAQQGEPAALQPATVTNLAEVVGLPRFLAVFIGTLAVATLLHAVSVAVRSRSGDLATMRALGITRRATGGVVSAYVGVLVAAALLVGVPLGLAVGRTVWRPIAEDANVVVRPVWPAGDVAVLVGVAVMIAAVLAAVAAWRVARLRPAVLLRTE
jgi:ABC-type lipoprotein release transport system permease subunit